VNSSTYPKSHLVIAALLVLFLLSFVGTRYNDGGERFNSRDVLQSVASHPPVTTSGTPPSPENADSQTLPEQVVQPVAPEPELRIKAVTVKPGDSLAIIFKREGFSPRQLHSLVTSEPLGPRLKDIFPGHELVFASNGAGDLVSFEYSPGPLETLVFTRNGKNFDSRELVAQPSRSIAYRNGRIDHSLFVASQRAGLDDALTMRLAQIFQWDIDFVLDIRKGDEFFVLYEDLYLGDEFIGHGRILAAEFVNQDERFQAVYFENDDHGDYYAPDGASMRKAFLRAPLEFSRISSNFNLRRKHPIWKRTMPHRGIDYVAPQNTPILAAGDGKVEKASRTEANGNFVILRHGEQFTTKYLHMSKFARGVRMGRSVEQGQVIGYVGSTGWATAPHLHYEFLVDGVHHNPRTVKLPNATPVPAAHRSAFDSSSTRLLTTLEQYKNQIDLALGQ
jgi:murein DD-endopeptidase MepM/ murein hydrolase activator NlpD